MEPHKINRDMKVSIAWHMGEWPSGPASSINFTEVKHGCVRSKNWMGDLPDERPKQLTPSSFGRDVKLGVPCPDAACIVGLN